MTGILVLWCALLLVQKVNLSRADIGRHIKNGEIMVDTSWSEKMEVLNTNFYSFTENNFPFVNHHWLSGVVFYFIFILGGFKGLSFFYIFLSCLSFYILFRIAKNEAGLEVASILSILVLPIITQRAEIRPEVFTYLFLASFFYILWKWTKEEITEESKLRDKKYLFLLPILMLLWINLHVGFIFGFLLLGSFWISEFVNFCKTKKIKRIKWLTLISLFSAILSLINPFFIKGLFYPFRIFENYGYLVLENQSISFLENLNITNGLHFGLIKFLYTLALLSFALPLFVKKDLRKFPIQNLIIFVATSIWSYFAVRDFPIFSLLFLPIVAYNIGFFFSKNENNIGKNLSITFLVITLVWFSLTSFSRIKEKESSFGIGLMPKVNAAVEFYKYQNIKGPIFNNYDIGGYLIFHLFPEEKVFVDNRPEAYSVDFFQKIYVPAQEKREEWLKLDQKYNFNSIFFSHLDLTPWGQNFLIQEVSDFAWAPVFADEYNIIFLKRNTQNAEIIKKYEIPKSNFGVTRQ